jgi:hypothetical protein
VITKARERLLGGTPGGTIAQPSRGSEFWSQIWRSEKRNYRADPAGCSPILGWNRGMVVNAVKRPAPKWAPRRRRRWLRPGKRSRSGPAIGEDQVVMP